MIAQPSVRGSGGIGAAPPSGCRTSSAPIRPSVASAHGAGGPKKCDMGIVIHNSGLLTNIEVVTTSPIIGAVRWLRCREGAMWTARNQPLLPKRITRLLPAQRAYRTAKPSQYLEKPKAASAPQAHRALPGLGMAALVAEMLPPCWGSVPRHTADRAPDGGWSFTFWQHLGCLQAL